MPAAYVLNKFQSNPYPHAIEVDTTSKGNGVKQVAKIKINIKTGRKYPGRIPIPRPGGPMKDKSKYNRKKKHKKQ
jgi:hypothetical protein